ncbi:MAG TPA: hypothetical protein VK843_12390 [Planctomycetota bacterium]|nr:hypothetical protein [Planctomycetota bacterium]
MFLLSLAAFPALASAQSNVRPLPSAALPPMHSSAASAGSSSSAGFDDLSGLPRPGEARGFVEVEGVAWLDRPASLSDVGGEVSSQRGGWNAAIGRELSGASLLSLRIETEASFYKFSGASGLIPGSNAPFNDLYRTSVGASWLSSRGEGLAGFLGGAVSLGGEDSASLSDSFFGGALAGLRYQPRKDIAISVGLQAQSRLEDSAWVAPFLGLEIALTDDLRFALEVSRVSLEQRLSPAWSLRGEVNYESRQFRLNSDNPLPRGVFRDERIDAHGALVWRGSSGCEIELGAGTSLWREYSFLDSSGSLAREVESDPALSATLALRLVF